MTFNASKRAALREACDIVERYLRTLGPNVTIHIAPDCVEIADDSWSGSAVEDTLFDALKDALTQIE